MVLVGKATQDPPRLKRKTCCSLPLEKTWGKNSSRKTQRLQSEKQSKILRSLKKSALFIAPGKDFGTKKIPKSSTVFVRKTTQETPKLKKQHIIHYPGKDLEQT